MRVYRLYYTTGTRSTFQVADSNSPPPTPSVCFNNVYIPCMPNNNNNIALCITIMYYYICTRTRYSRYTYTIIIIICTCISYIIYYNNMQVVYYYSCVDFWLLHFDTQDDSSALFTLVFSLIYIENFIFSKFITIFKDHFDRFLYHLGSFL